MTGFPSRDRKRRPLTVVQRQMLTDARCATLRARLIEDGIPETWTASWIDAFVGSGAPPDAEDLHFWEMAYRSAVHAYRGGLV